MLNLLRNAYIKLFGSRKRKFRSDNLPDMPESEASSILYDLIISGKPFMVARLGNVEYDAVFHYKATTQRNPYWSYITGAITEMGWPEFITKRLVNNAGFFPPDEEQVVRFCQLMQRELSEIDVLGALIDLENEFKSELAGSIKIHRRYLKAYNSATPWSRALQGKRVLIVHPFVDTMRKQYARRHDIWNNREILPDFDLLTYKPVQSIAGNYSELTFETWFDALKHMQKEIDRIEFDIALLGCGAYGLPLAAHIKRSGRQAIHIGGALQIFFGIMGKRWEEEFDMTTQVNEYWVRPSADEIPKNHELVEGGCYW